MERFDCNKLSETMQIKMGKRGLFSSPFDPNVVRIINNRFETLLS